MKGMTWASIRKHPSLLPLYFFTALGGVMAGGYLLRIATKSPEVSWNKRGNPEPWNDYAGKQYKFMTVEMDYSKLEDKRPKF